MAVIKTSDLFPVVIPEIIKKELDKKPSLDEDGKIPMTDIPDAALGTVRYQDEWDAKNNIPPIPHATPENQGFYYTVSVDGNTDISGISVWHKNDWIISNGTKWNKVDNSENVTSVAGKRGAVKLNNNDVGLGNVENKSSLEIRNEIVDSNIPSNIVRNNKLEEVKTELKGDVRFKMDITPENFTKIMSGEKGQMYRFIKSGYLADITISENDFAIITQDFNSIISSEYYKLFNRGNREVPIGSIMSFMGKKIPDGWLLCDGSQFDSKIYSSLYITLESDRVPDLRGYFLRGFDPLGTIDPNGTSRELGDVQEDDVKPHIHNMTQNGHHTHNGSTESGGEHNHKYHLPQGRKNVKRGNANKIEGPDFTLGLDTTKNGAHTHNFTTNEDGRHKHTIQNNMGNETRPKNISVNYIIRCI